MEAPSTGELLWVPYVDWLLTQLVLAAPAQLSAELVGGAASISWRLQSFDPAREQTVDTLRSVFFRPVLARIASTYMPGCVYGGFRRFHLRSGILTHPVVFYLANDSLTGCWFRGRCGRDIVHQEVPAA